MIKPSVLSRSFGHWQIRAVISAGVAVALALVIGAGGWLFLSRLSETAGKDAHIQRAAGAQDIAGRVGERLAAYERSLADLAALPETRALFAGADPAALAAAGQRHAGRFAGALRLRYILAGNYQLDSASLPPLSYASLDMLIQAETNVETLAEVHLHGTPAAHVVILEPIRNGAPRPIGFLHLSLSTAILNDLLSDIGPDEGYVELIQPVSNRNIVLAMAGAAAVRQADPATADIPGTRLQIAYWARKSLILSVIEDGGRWLPYLPALLILLGALGFLLRKRKNAEAEARARVEAEAAADTLSETLVSAAGEESPPPPRI